MIDYTLGVPGSGKTYRAVYMLYHTFKNDGKIKKFFDNDHFFTNINEFNFDKFDKSIGFKFDFDLFYSELSMLYALKESGANDTELIVEAKKYNHYNGLFVIDECHNHFDKDDKILVWWLTYHRHLHQNVLMITQNLALVKPKYKVLTENFFSAVPSSRRFSFFGKKLQYKHYATSKMQKSDLAGSVDIPFSDEVYACYHSGGNTQSKNIVMKYVYVSLIFLFILFALFYGIKLFWTSKYIKDDPKKNQTSAAGSTVPVSVSPVFQKNIFFCDEYECSDGTLLIDLLKKRPISTPVYNCPGVRKYTVSSK